MRDGGHAKCQDRAKTKNVSAWTGVCIICDAACPCNSRLRWLQQWSSLAVGLQMLKSSWTLDAYISRRAVGAPFAAVPPGSMLKYDVELIRLSMRGPDELTKVRVEKLFAFAQLTELYKIKIALLHACACVNISMCATNETNRLTGVHVQLYTTCAGHRTVWRWWRRRVSREVL